jgi:serine phosphatase RsbU (regulator of sigma subunit)/pSer/pThr/pTyr-binding forkhead associated (FHA) protein
MPLLVHRTGSDRGQRFYFERTVLLGRGPLADLEVKDPAVSRRHAQISLSDGRCFVADLGSGNGTFVNGQRIGSPVALAEGDEVRLGGTVFEFRGQGERGRDREKTSNSRVSIREAELHPGSRSLVMPLAGLRTHGGTRLAEEVVRLKRRLDFFAEAGRVLARTLDGAALLDQLLAKAMEVLPQADRAFVVRYEAESGEFKPLAARTRGGGSTDIPASRTLLEEVVKKKEALVSIDAAAEEEFQTARSIHLLNLRAVACVPLLVEDRITGVLQVDNGQQQRGFGEADLDLLAGIAGPIALALEHARLHRELVERELLEHDLALARRIQQSFLPSKPPQVPGWRVAVEYSPASQVGGDLYDLVPMPDGRLGVAIGDVSGKGVSGALLMARLTSGLRAAAARNAHPATVLEELNDLVHGEGADGMFVTLAWGVLDPASGRMEIANAGHLKPIVRHRDGRSGELQLPAGTALGIRRPLQAPTVAWTVAPGDLVLFPTDGLTEAATPAGERFESTGILTALAGVSGSDPRAALDAVLKSARAFVSTRGFDDDLTVVCLGRD